MPASWTRNDDDLLSGRIVRAAEHALAALGPTGSAQRSRLLSTLALELRGTTTDRAAAPPHEAETIARDIGDPGLVAFALNARFMHAFHSVGLADARAGSALELVELAARHHLVTFEVLGHLVLVQANCALADRPAADAHARAADRLAERYELPLVGVFTRWYAALRLALDGDSAAAAQAYRSAAERLPADGMPGLTQGLLPLAVLGLRLADTIGADRPNTGLDPTDRPPPDSTCRPADHRARRGRLGGPGLGPARAVGPTVAAGRRRRPGRRRGRPAGSSPRRRTICCVRYGSASSVGRRAPSTTGPR